MDSVSRRLCLCFYKRHLHNNGKFHIQTQSPRHISTFHGPLFYKTGYGTGPSARVKAEMDAETEEHLKVNNIKAKDHPGIFHLPKISLPERYWDAIRLIMSHEKVKLLAADADYLRNYIWSRRLPIESENLKAKVAKLEEEILRKEEAMLPFLNAKQREGLERKARSKLITKLNQSTYHWQPLNFTRHLGLQYLIARTPGEYASLVRIFNEIFKRDPEFKPETLCDFGSGLGTVTWAARNFWGSSLKEHLFADISADMNDLAELILRGGNWNNDHPIPALFFRQHLPESYKIRYDLVVSAYSFFELPSAKARLELIDKLWKKTEKYLVIVESGTKAGFRAIMEARDYILQLDNPDKKVSPQCHVFSPCPSSNQCPRFTFDVIPCNFTVKYRPLLPFHIDGCQNDKFCYIVLKRGRKNPHEESWPRLVADPLIRPRHVICRVCTKDANISEAVLTKSKHSLNFRVLARRSRDGDLLPVHVSELEKRVIDETEDDVEE